MDGRHRRTHAVKLLVRSEHGLQYRRVHVGIPAVVAARKFGFGPGERKDGGDGLAQRFLLAADRAAEQALQSDAPAVGNHARKVGRSLHEPRHGHRHAHHAVGTADHGLDELRRRIGRDDPGGRIARVEPDRDGILDSLELGDDGLFVGGHRIGESLMASRRNQHDGFGFARDGVAQTAAVDRREHDPELLSLGVEQPEKQLVGVGALGDNLDARMAALEPLDREPGRLEIARRRRNLGVTESHVGVQTAGTADVQLALGLGIEVQQDVALQKPGFQPESSVHAGLLGRGEERFERSVNERIVLKDSHDGRRPDTVVGAQGRAVGRDPPAVDIGVDRIGREIELLVVVLLRHHVEVGLQNHPLAVLHAGRRGLADIDVVGLVLAAFEPERTGEIENITADLLLVRRGARDADDFGEMLPDERGLERG